MKHSDISFDPDQLCTGLFTRRIKSPYPPLN